MEHYPSVPATVWKRLDGSNVITSALTGSTDETEMASATLPAYLLGKNGLLKITTLWQFTNNGNSKTWRVKLGGSSFAAVGGGSIASTHDVRIIRCANSYASQVTTSQFTGAAYGTSGSAPYTATIDLTSAQTISLTAQLTNAADSAYLVSWLVEYMTVA